MGGESQLPSTRKERSLLLFAMSSGVSLIFLNATLLPVALPTIQKQIGFSTDLVYWIINAYLLAIAAFVIAGGRVGDLFGHRKMFCLGMSLYTVASVAGGLAETGGWLIMTRSIQGIGSALLSPAAMSIVVHAFPENQRGKSIGTMIAIGSLFLILGPLVGGFFTEYLSWRWAFWVNVPLGSLGVILAMKAVPMSKRLDETFDFLGFLCISLGLFFLVFGLMQATAWGAFNLRTLICLGLTALCFIGLKLSERRVHHPFFNFRLFKNRIFLGGSMLIVMTQFMLMITVFWPLFFQNVYMDSPMIAGLLTTIACFPLIVVAPFSGSLADRKGPRVPIKIGFFSLIICFLWFFVFLPYHNLLWLLPALLFFGSGIALVLTPVSATTVSSVSRTATGVATGMYSMLRFVGATLGVAVLGAIQARIKMATFSRDLLQNPGTETLNPYDYEGLLTGVSSSLAAASSLTPDLMTYVKDSLFHATTWAFSSINLVTAGVALFSFLLTSFFFKKKLSDTRK